MRVTLIGAGRAGTSFARALASRGHHVSLVHHDATPSLVGVDLVILTVPDDALAALAATLPASRSRVVAHVAGSRTLDVLAPHPRRASLHPLAALPSAEVGAERLIGATYAVAGDPLVEDLVASLDGRSRHVPDAVRTVYHATAAVAANHVVALLGHVERLAEAAGLALEDVLPLVHQAVEDVARRGPASALTGPASRGDVATIDAHLAAIPPGERSTYVALAREALDLAERRDRTAASWSA